MNKFRLLVGTGAFLMTTPIFSGNLIINEIMQSNIDCIMDDLNDFPDSWIELANITDQTINLGNYAIGDSKKPKKSYHLPSIDIPAGGKIIVYCDKVGEGLHTNFRLESAKDCEAYLFLNDEIVDQLPEGMKKQPAPNIAFGRITDGAEKWGYMAVPTPGEENCGRLLSKILSNPEFSVPGHIGIDPFSLSISVPDDAPEGTQIHYTLDGKEPTAESDVWTEDMYISRSTVVRAVLVCDGYMSPRSTTHSYIFDPNDTKLQFVSIVTDPDYFYDDQIGIYVIGKDEDNPNYNYDWRRPINIEFFTAKDTEAVINQLGETKVKGGETRIKQLKSLALYANKRFGEKRFNYEFFPDYSPGISDFKSVELRNMGNDYNYAMMRDVVIQESFGMNVDLDWQPHQGMIVYINGEYIGFMNLRPRSNEDYIYAYYEGLEDVDVIERWSEVEQGTIDNFNDFKNFYMLKEHSLDEWRDRIDVEEFLNLFIMNIFYDNKDWPNNNIVQWRPLEEGGKWRWIGKDTDLGLGWLAGNLGAAYPTLKWVLNQYEDNTFTFGNNERGTICFKNFLENEEGRQLFIDRSATYLGDFLRADRILAIVDREAEEIRPEVQRLKALETSWRRPFDDEMTLMRAWIKDRVPYFYQELADVFELGTPTALTINANHNDLVDIEVNGFKLSEPYFNGKWFANSVVNISSSDEGLKGWLVEYDIDGTTSTIEFPQAGFNFEIPECEAVRISPIIQSSYIENISEVSESKFNLNNAFSAYGLDSVNLGEYENFHAFKSTACPGVYILYQNGSHFKIVIR